MKKEFEYFTDLAGGNLVSATPPSEKRVRIRSVYRTVSSMGVPPPLLDLRQPKCGRTVGSATSPLRREFGYKSKMGFLPRQATRGALTSSRWVAHHITQPTGCAETGIFMRKTAGIAQNCQMFFSAIAKNRSPTTVLVLQGMSSSRLLFL